MDTGSSDIKVPLSEQEHIPGKRPAFKNEALVYIPVECRLSVRS